MSPVGHVCQSDFSGPVSSSTVPERRICSCRWHATLPGGRLRWQRWRGRYSALSPCRSRVLIGSPRAERVREDGSSPREGVPPRASAGAVERVDGGELSLRALGAGDVVVRRPGLVLVRSPLASARSVGEPRTTGEGLGCIEASSRASQAMLTLSTTEKRLICFVMPGLLRSSSQ